MWQTFQYVKKQQQKVIFFQIPAKFSEHSLCSVMSLENHISVSFYNIKQISSNLFLQLAPFSTTLS